MELVFPFFPLLSDKFFFSINLPQWISLSFSILGCYLSFLSICITSPRLLFSLWFSLSFSNPRSLPSSVSESRLLRSSSCSVFAMLTSLDFLSIVYAPNGPFVFCKPCGSVIATNPHDAGKDYPLTRKDHL